jgi:hypothetical protein
MKETEQVKAPKRCQFDCCKVKLGLIAFPCRCGNFYCPTHRFSEDHKCTYNYKEDQKKELLKFMSSPVIAPKVEIM